MAVKRSNLYTVTVDFFLSNGDHYIRRKITERGLTQKSVTNKIKREYGNQKKYGKLKIVSIVRRYR